LCLPFAATALLQLALVVLVPGLLKLVRFVMQLVAVLPVQELAVMLLVLVEPV
jgi:hypothetical protein